MRSSAFRCGLAALAAVKEVAQTQWQVAEAAAVLFNLNCQWLLWVQPNQLQLALAGLVVELVILVEREEHLLLLASRFMVGKVEKAVAAAETEAVFMGGVGSLRAARRQGLVKAMLKMAGRRFHQISLAAALGLILGGFPQLAHSGVAAAESLAGEMV